MTSLKVALALAVSLSALQGVPQTPQTAATPTPAGIETANRILAAATDEERRGIIDGLSNDQAVDVRRALSNRGIEMRRASRFDEATRAYVAARAVAEKSGDRVALGLLLVNWSAIPGQQADYPAALKLLDEALAIGDDLKNDGVVGAALANLAIIHKLTGDYDKALEVNERALALAVKAGDKYTQGRVYSNMGVVLRGQGRFREALEAYDKSLALKRELNEGEVEIGLGLNNIGTVHADQGNLELALDYFKRALVAITSNGEMSGDAASELNNIGAMYREMGQLDTALDYFRQALAVHERAGNRVGIATMAYNIASVQRLRGNTAAALEGYQRSLELRTAIRDRAGMIESLESIAGSYGLLKRWEDGLAVAERAATLARELRSPELLWGPLGHMAGFKHELGDSAGAESLYRQSIDAIEEVRAEVAGGADSRRRFFEDKLETYHDLTKVLLEQNKVVEAFAIAERARGRALSDVFGANAAVRPLSPMERVRQKELAQDVGNATARLSALERTRSSAAAQQDATEHLRKARLAFEEFRDALDARYPVRRLARGDVNPDTLKAIAAALPDNRTAMLEYVVTESTTYLFIATKDAAAQPAVQMVPIRIRRPALTTRVNALQQKLATRALDFHADARAIYELLVKPAAQAIADRTRLIVIPDDVLWTIPFEALEPSDDRVLLDALAVSYAPSIELLNAMRARHVSLGMPSGGPRLVVAADPDSDQQRLPDAAKQARDLSALYGSSRVSSFVGGAAGEASVRAAVAGADVLHFATHGVVDDRNPMYSFLQLARSGAAADAESDGRLEAWEIQSLPLKACVAVLTACETARGTIGRGEGVIGLAWAFFAAGTPATVVSLWKLESGSATALTTAFHEKLRASMSKGRPLVAESLRDAALQIRKDPRYRHPYYWAGLVAIGNGF